MMMVVDFSAHDKQFTEVCEDLNRIGEEIGVVIHVQREELFEKMHRI